MGSPTPSPTPTPTQIPDGLRDEVENLGELVAELSSDGCAELYEKLEEGKTTDNIDDIFVDAVENPRLKSAESSSTATPSPSEQTDKNEIMSVENVCSKEDERFNSPELRKACLQCFAFHNYGVRITSNLYADEVRILVNAIINIDGMLRLRIRQTCSDLNIPDSLDLRRLFFDDITVNLMPGGGYAQVRPGEDESNFIIDFPYDQFVELRGKTFTTPEWLLLHEFSHGLHNRLGFCGDDNPLLDSGTCNDVIVHSIGDSTFDIQRVGNIPVVVWQFLEATGGYWNLSGERDFGEWLADGHFVATDLGVNPLTSLNYNDGQRIEGMYSGVTIDPNIVKCKVETNAEGKEFVYVNREGKCVSKENAVYFREVETYVPNFSNVVGDIGSKMPNATGATGHASPKEDFADSLAHFIKIGPNAMRSSTELGLGSDDPRVRFIEDNFCTWIEKLISADEQGATHG